MGHVTIITCDRCGMERRYDDEASFARGPEFNRRIVLGEWQYICLTCLAEEAAMPPRLTWDELCPEGAIRFYEGDDPDGFAAEMRDGYGIDVTETHEDDWQRTNWRGHRSFFIPAGLVETIYGNERWPLGS